MSLTSLPGTTGRSLKTFGRCRQKNTLMKTWRLPGLSATSCMKTQNWAESKCPPSGLVDWALTDFSHMYCDVFTVITSRLMDRPKVLVDWLKCGFGQPLALPEFPGTCPQGLQVQWSPDICIQLCWGVWCHIIMIWPGNTETSKTVSPEHQPACLFVSWGVCAGVETREEAWAPFHRALQGRLGWQHRGLKITGYNIRFLSLFFFFL